LDAHKNFGYSTVLTPPTGDAPITLVVQSGHGARFPTPPFNATVWPAGEQPLSANAEIVRVTAISTDTLTITRAQEGSTQRTIVVGDQIAATITAKTLTDVEAAVRVAKNLIVENLAATPNSKVRITVDSITVEDMLFASVDETADIAASGADGLDTGSEAASTWYAVWLIAKLDGTLASLLSTSFTSPTMPSGYVKKRRVGTVRNDASSNFLPFTQVGELVSYRTNSAETRLLSAGGATTYTDVNCAAVVPPGVIMVWMLLLKTATSAVSFMRVRRNGDSGDTRWTSGASTTLGISTAHWVIVDTSANRTIEYLMSVAESAAYIDMMGYIDPVL